MSKPKVQSAERRFHRAKTLKSGRVIGMGGYMTVDCTIRNLSKGGARLEFPQVTYVPDEVILQIGQGDFIQESVPCLRRWQRGTAVGVMFLEPLNFVHW